jgi:hypothetical protein
MREYHLPSGEVIPAELLDRIHEDGRAFEAAQTPAARSAAALRKISNELPRLRMMLAGTGPEQTAEMRQAVALEIVALGELGFTSDDLRKTFPARNLMRRYGLLTTEESETP